MPSREPAATPPAQAEEPAADAAPESSDLPAQLADLDVSKGPQPVVQEPPRLAALGLARIVSIDVDGNIEIEVAGRYYPAKADVSVHTAVLKTSEERGESVLIEQRGKDFLIVGALRTQPTPGIDKMSDITLEADTIQLKAKREVVMSSGVAAIALRAVGEVETYADRIMSRAESVHKIIGRMLRLN